MFISSTQVTSLVQLRWVQVLRRQSHHGYSSCVLQVSNLPTPNVFIMDEPGTALDAENMDGFVRILDMVKNYYKIVILISHLDALKDCVDYVINVEKENGYAKVNV